MRIELGVAIRNSSICVATAADESTSPSAFAWAASRPYTTDTLADELTSMLMEACERLGARLTICVAFGPSVCHLKRVAGLPEGLSLHEARLVIESNHSRYFLGASTEWQVLAVHKGATGVWVATMSRVTYAAVLRAARRTGTTVSTCVPTLAVLRSASSDGVRDWTDGQHTYSVVTSNGEPLRVQILNAVDNSIAPTAPTLEDAQLAVTSGAASVFASFPHRESRDRRKGTILRVLLLTACVLGIGGALVGPSVIAHLSRARAERAYDALRPSLLALERTRSSLAATMGLVAAAHEFRDTGPSAHRVLEGLTGALPLGGALVSVRIDSIRAVTTVVLPAEADFGSTVQIGPTQAQARIRGSATSEMVGEVEYQRMTLEVSLRDERKPGRRSDER